MTEWVVGVAGQTQLGDRVGGGCGRADPARGQSRPSVQWVVGLLQQSVHSAECCTFA